jgi:serine phosphatase RsbU (regulator of sigma subunit)
MNGWRWAGVAQPVASETDCGDALACLPFEAGLGGEAGHLLALVDGLGHGSAAAVAAHAALALLRQHPQADPVALLTLLDPALHGTRGAAVGLAQVRPGQLRYAAVGNTRALRWRDGRATRLESCYGIVGDGVPPGLETITLELRPGDWLLLFSDGLDEMLNVTLMLPEWQREPRLLCEHLLARWRNPRDDAAVLAGVVLDD